VTSSSEEFDGLLDALPYQWETPFVESVPVRTLLGFTGLSGAIAFLTAAPPVVLAPGFLVAWHYLRRRRYQRVARDFLAADVDDPPPETRVLRGSILAVEHDDLPPIARIVRGSRVRVASQRFLVGNPDQAVIVAAPHIHVLHGPPDSSDILPISHAFRVLAGTDVVLVYAKTATRSLPSWARPHLAGNYRDSVESLDVTVDSARHPLLLRVAKVREGAA